MVEQMKFVIVDIDGTIANNTIRENCANSQFKKESEDWWRAFTNPAMIKTDVPILYSILVLQEYNKRGYEIIYLTGRDDSLRQATSEWLETIRIMGKDTEIKFPEGRLIMTPSIYVSSDGMRVATFKQAVVRKFKQMGSVDYVFDDDGINLREIGKEKIPNLELVQTNSEMWWKNYLYTKMGKKEYEMNRGGIMARAKRNPQSYQHIENELLDLMRLAVSHYRDPRWESHIVTRWNNVRDVMLKAVKVYAVAFTTRDQAIFQKRYPVGRNLIVKFRDRPYDRPNYMMNDLEKELQTRTQKSTLHNIPFRTPYPTPEGFTTPPTSEWKYEAKVLLRSDLEKDEKYHGMYVDNLVMYAGEIIVIREAERNEHGQSTGIWRGYTDMDYENIMFTPEMTTAPDVQHLIKRPTFLPPPPPPSIFVTPEGERVEVPLEPSRFEFLEPLYQENPQSLEHIYNELNKYIHDAYDSYTHGNIEQTKISINCFEGLWGSGLTNEEQLEYEKEFPTSRKISDYLGAILGYFGKGAIIPDDPFHPLEKVWATPKQFQNNPFMGEFMDYPVSKQYQSLNDKYPRGNIEIWYWKNPENNVSGKLWCMEVMKGNLPKIEDIANDYARVGNIEATNEEDIYMKMQAEVWSPRGEARELILSKGLSHTSMSMGDIIVIRPSGEVFVVDSIGFSSIGVM